MRLSWFALALLAGALLAVLFFQAPSRASQLTNPQPAPSAGELQSITLVFGSKDSAPSPWDGSISLSSGQIERLAGYHFDENARLTGPASWSCSTYPWGTFAAGMHPNEKPQPHPTPLQPCGVTVYFRAPSSARFQVKLPKGEFSFRLIDLPETEGIFPLNASVEIYRTPVVHNLTTAQYEDDSPSLAADGNRLFLAWTAYRNQGDLVFLRSTSDGASWSDPVQITDRPADIFGAAVAVSNSEPVIVWSEQTSNGFQLKARSPGRPVETLTSAPGNHIFHRVAAGPRGGVHVVWQSFRSGRSAIYLRSRVAGRWAPEISLSDPQRDPRSNDWDPAVAVTRDGTIWVAWDSYSPSSYNIFLRAVRNGQPGPLTRVTDSPRFHAHPTLAVDSRDRLWVAWDEARENWGKDVGFLFTGGTGLYDSRSIRIAVHSAGAWLEPRQPVSDVVPYGFRRFTQQPRLVSDSRGRMWLFFRPRSNTKLPTSVWAAGGKWEVYATAYEGDRWREPVVVPESVGRNEAEISVAAGPDGNVYAALVTDHRRFGGPNFSHPPGNNDIVLARLNSALPPATIELGPRAAEPPALKPTEPNERQQIRALRAYTIPHAGQTLRIYRGDLHRHTEISLDGAGDGSLYDAYRYALDAAGMDFLAVTDHQSGQPNEALSDYHWWRIQKSADLFHTPGFFTALYGTERSLGYPNGHRNLIFARRGVPILHIGPLEAKAAANTGAILYPFLRKHQGIATSHTSHTGMGTDWRDNDPDLEPIVEIYQGARTSAEREGAPLAPTEARTELWAGGYRPLGFVANAWAKGYKLGVQASSDHVSTHLSYACVLAESSSREALLDAMRRRHTYAATSNIILDYRVAAAGQTYLQGDAFAARALPELTAHIVGSAPLRQVVIIRDNQVIYSQQPSTPTYDLRFRETSLPSGEHFYYVRVEQTDGNVAWSSPVWINYTQP